jgi:hypothetical protein
VRDDRQKGQHTRQIGNTPRAGVAKTLQVTKKAIDDLPQWFHFPAF